MLAAACSDQGMFGSQCVLSIVTAVSRSRGRWLRRTRSARTGLSCERPYARHRALASHRTGARTHAACVRGACMPTCGGVLGVGIGQRLSHVRWGLAGSMVPAWVLSLPAAGMVAAAFWKATNALGSDNAGPIVMAIVTAAGAAGLFFTTQRHAV